MLAGKALTVNMLEVTCFQTPIMVTQPFVSQHKAHIWELANYLEMSLKYIEFIWFGNLLLMRRCVWNAYSIIILADNCGCGVICYCGMSRGHCCILGTPLSSVFWQLTIPLKGHKEVLNSDRVASMRLGGLSKRWKCINPLQTRLLCYCSVSGTRLFYDVMVISCNQTRRSPGLVSEWFP